MKGAGRATSASMCEPRLPAGHGRRRVSAPASAPAQAQSLDDWLHQHYLTGDWGGFRTSLEAEGITSARPLPLGDGRQSDAAGCDRARNMPSRSISAPTSILASWWTCRGGQSAHVTFTDRAGQESCRRGHRQSDLGAGDLRRRSEFSPRRAVLSAISVRRRLEAKIGWIHAADDFAHSPIYCYFQNNGFCGQPAGIPIDSGVHHLPGRKLGRHREVAPAAATSIFRPAPMKSIPRCNNTSNGFKLNTAGATGVIVPVEAGWQAGSRIGQIAGQLQDRRLLRQFRRARPRARL